MFELKSDLLESVSRRSRRSYEAVYSQEIIDSSMGVDVVESLGDLAISENLEF